MADQKNEFGDVPLQVAPKANAFGDMPVPGNVGDIPTRANNPNAPPTTAAKMLSGAYDQSPIPGILNAIQHPENLGRMFMPPLASGVANVYNAAKNGNLGDAAKEYFKAGALATPGASAVYSRVAPIASDISRGDFAHAAGRGLESAGEGLLAAGLPAAADSDAFATASDFAKGAAPRLPWPVGPIFRAGQSGMRAARSGAMAREVAGMPMGEGPAPGPEIPWEPQFLDPEMMRKSPDLGPLPNRAPITGPMASIPSGGVRPAGPQLAPFDYRGVRMPSGKTMGPTEQRPVAPTAPEDLSKYFLDPNAGKVTPAPQIPPVKGPRVPLWQQGKITVQPTAGNAYTPTEPPVATPTDIPPASASGAPAVTVIPRQGYIRPGQQAAPDVPIPANIARNPQAMSLSQQLQESINEALRATPRFTQVPDGKGGFTVVDRSKL